MMLPRLARPNKGAGRYYPFARLPAFHFLLSVSRNFLTTGAGSWNMAGPQAVRCSRGRAFRRLARPPGFHFAFLGRTVPLWSARVSFPQVDLRKQDAEVEGVRDT